MRSAVQPKGDFYEFGSFALDPLSKSLSRSGNLVPLTPKVFEILLLLVENGGRVVRKSEILDRVWPGISVEEGSIAQNISVIRKALDPWFEGESPIGTIARVGYRFNAEVRLRNPRAEIELVSPAAPAETALVIATPIPDVHRAKAGLWVALAACLALAAAVLVFFYMRTAPNGPRRSVAVLALKDLSGDPKTAWLSTALTETLASELGTGERLRAISGENVRRSMKDLSIDPGGIGKDQLAALRRNLGCDLVLTGSYLDIDGKLRVDVNLIDAATGRPVTVISSTDIDGNLLDLVARTGIRMRSKLDIAQPSGSQEEAIRASVSSDPAAARAYFRGLDALRLRDFPASRQALERAIVADSSFALAHSALASALGSLGYDAMARSEAKKAFDMSARLPREDRLTIEAQFYQASYNWAKAAETWRSLWTLFPDNPDYGLDLGSVQSSAGLAKEVLHTAEQLRSLPVPLREDPRIALLEANGAQMEGDFARAETASGRAFATASQWNARSLQARALSKKALAESHLGEGVVSLRDLEQARLIFGKLGDKAEAANQLRLHAYILSVQQQWERSAGEFNAALAQARELGYARLISRSLDGLGNIYRSQGRLGDAARALTEASNLSRSMGDRFETIDNGTALGIILKLRGDFAGAASAYRSAAAGAQETGNRQYYAIAMNDLASLAIVQGHPEEAQRDLAPALAVQRETNDRAYLAVSLGNSARIAEMRGDLKMASAALTEQCAIREALDMKASLAACRISQAMVFLESGQKANARAALDKAFAAPLKSSALLNSDWAEAATAQLELGDIRGAARSIDLGRQTQKGRDYIAEQDLPLETASALLDAARGGSAAAAVALGQIRSKAEHAGLEPIALEAGLALAKTRGSASAPDVQSVAEHTGLLLFAGRARDLRAR